MKPVLNIIFLCLLGINQIIHAQYSESDWQWRDTWMNVPKIMKLANIESGSKVADIGCHEGYFTTHLASKVTDAGQVYAVDVRKDRLDRLREHLKERKLTNVKVVLGDYDNPRLPEATLDVVVIMDTYHEMDDYMQILKHVKKSLKPDGRIVILEKLKMHIKNGSRKEQTLEHTLSAKYVKEELEKAGFTIVEEIKKFGNWKNEENKKMWILIGIPKRI